MIEIDGSLGEGGGQVLRSALALSILTGQEFSITNIRAARPKPGLRPQHLEAVDAAAAVSKAQVEGAALHSSTLRFWPGEIRSGRYKFDIGTAGAATLVLQTILLPLSRAGSASTVIVTGGTHVPWSPAFHYLDLHWQPYLQAMGCPAQLSLDSAGFYPEGGGRISATIRPAESLAPLHLDRRGELRQVQVLSGVANLDVSIADRQKRQALRRLEKLTLGGPAPRARSIQLPARFKGTFLLLLAEFENGRCCYVSLGRLGKPAEQVADEALDGFEAYLQSEAAVDEYMADQLLLPLSLAHRPSVVSTCRVTNHLLTNAEIVRRFLPVEIQIQGELDQPGIVRVHPGNG